MVRIVAPDEDGQSLGSGTLVYVSEKHALVITNWHVIRDATGPVEVIFPDGFRSAGTVIKSDNEWDLAAIGIWRPNVQPVPIAREAPCRGDSLTIAGYGQGRYRAVRGFCTQYVAPSDVHPSQMIELSAEARQGDSGGPILNSQGQLAGVLLGATKGRTVGSYFARVEEFLADVRPVLDHEQARAAIASSDSTPSPDETPHTPLASIPNPTDEAVKDLAAANIDAAYEQEPFDAEQHPQRAVIPALSKLVPFQRPATAADPAVQDTFFRPAIRPTPSLDATATAGGRDELSAFPSVADTDAVFRLTDVVGTSRGEQIKSLLAAIGVFSMLIFTFKILRIEG